VPSANGILLIDKPEGMPSASVVRVVKKTLAEDKVGHLGTLDPFASGLLPLCLGVGTKIAQFLMTERKAYIGTIRLGIETDTLDGTGTITRTAAVPFYPPEALQDLQQQFSGDYWQTPPMYSALKRQGVPLYKLARRGIEVEREPRKVTIERFSLEPLGNDTLKFSLVCSKGTYVRSLAADLGVVLGCGAHLATLRRTEFGPFSIENAVSLAQLSDCLERGSLSVFSLVQALQHYRTLRLEPHAVARLRRGQQDILRDLPSVMAKDELAQLVSPDGELVAMVQENQGQWKLIRVFLTLH